MNKSFFTISLDFELYWGVRDVFSLSSYKENILGVRLAIPKMLKLFNSFDIHVTWAVVGFLTFNSKKDLISYIPEILPEYKDPKLDPYLYLDYVGKNEDSDPFHFGYSLLNCILEYENMEIASHTFSHFYCLEEKKNIGSFGSDLIASRESLNRLQIDPSSIIFCRNQYDDFHLNVAKRSGFVNFRGNESSDLYAPLSAKDETLIRRFGRLCDSYFNLSGNNFSLPVMTDDNLLNIPSSRFLRPHVPELSYLQHLKLFRIKSSMTKAAKTNTGFHLWWHPHNFGINISQNLLMLEEILLHFYALQGEYGMESLNMSEVRKRYDYSVNAKSTK